MNKKLLRKKLALMLANLKKKRKYYVELEYLESTGTQWIDPGVIPTSNMEFYTKIRFNSDQDLNNDVAVIGVRSGMSRLQPIHAYQNKWAIGIGDNYAAGRPLAVDTDYNIRSIVSDGKTVHLYVNDVLSSSITNTNGIPSSPLYFMTRNLNGAPNPITKMRANFLKIYSEGSLVRDFIPVLDWDMRPCMYDKVSGELFYNKGTGEFLFGRQIHPVEYLESTGTQYIDTGVYMHNSLSFSFRFSPIQASDGYPSAYMGGAYAYGSVVTAQVSFVCTSGINGSGNRFMNFNVVPRAEISFGEWYDYYADKNYIQIGNAKAYLGSDIASTTALKTIDIFAILYNGSYIFGKTKISFFKIYDNGVLIRDFIPAIDENGVGFMFDRVTHTIFDNAGSGAFGYNPVELEYLQSTGTQYIDTGALPTNTTEFELSCYYDNDVGYPTGENIFGMRYLLGAQWRYSISNYKAINGCGYAAFGNNRRAQTTEKGIHEYIFSYKNGIFSNGHNISQPIDISNDVPPITPIPSSWSLWLFAGNFPNEDYRDGTKGKVYYLKIWDNGVLIRDFIPCYKDGQLGMWDKVNKVFYPNLGTGSFVGGAIVEPEYE